LFTIQFGRGERYGQINIVAPSLRALQNFVSLCDSI